MTTLLRGVLSWGYNKVSSYVYPSQPEMDPPSLEEDNDGQSPRSTGQSQTDAPAPSVGRNIPSPVSSEEAAQEVHPIEVDRLLPSPGQSQTVSPAPSEESRNIPLSVSEEIEQPLAANPFEIEVEDPFAVEEALLDPIDNKKLIRNDRKTLEILNKYFTVYAQNLIPLDEATLHAIERIVEIDDLREDIAQETSRLLCNGTIEGTHRKIPVGLVTDALKIQGAFEQELLRWKEIDACQRLWLQKVEPELSLLRNVSVFDEKTGLLAEIEKKAIRNGRTFEEQVQISIQMREDLIAKLQEKISSLQAKPEDKFLSTEFLEKTLGRARNQQKLPIVESLDVQVSIRDHYVLAVGDPLTHPEEAKFIILKRPEDVSEETWTSPKFRENIKKDYPKEPHRSIFIHLNSGLLDFKGRIIEVTQENVAETLKTHVNRGLLQKTLRKKTAYGSYERGNYPHDQKALETWDKHLEATAGPDCHEAIALNRLLIERILQNNAENISFNHFQVLVEYFDSLSVNPVTDLKGSYTEQLSFREAIQLQEQMNVMMKQKYEAQTLLPILEMGIKSKYSQKADAHRMRKIKEDLCDVYTTWNGNLSKFIDQLKEDQEARTNIGGEVITDLTYLNWAIADFVKLGFESLRNPLGDEESTLVETMVQMRTHLQLMNSKLVPLSAWLSEPKNQEKIQVCQGYDKAIPQILQLKVKINLVLKELMEGTELSPTWLEMAETAAAAKSQVISSELERSRQAKKMQAHLIV